MPHFIAEALCETLWPTRCALCDTLGTVLCDSCAAALVPLDFWQACPACGAPWGRIQCDHCTPLVDLHAFDDIEPVCRRCVSALTYDERSARLIKTFKDKGEQRLARPLARILAQAIPPSWRIWAQAVTYITATRDARRRRGFDHMSLVAQQLAECLELPCMRLLEEPRTSDQRALTRASRSGNTENRFRPIDGPLPQRVILVDDVFTTGATARTAQRALSQRGCLARVATIARV